VFAARYPFPHASFTLSHGPFQTPRSRRFILPETHEVSDKLNRVISLRFSPWFFVSFLFRNTPFPPPTLRFLFFFHSVCHLFVVGHCCLFCSSDVSPPVTFLLSPPLESLPKTCAVQRCQCNPKGTYSITRQRFLRVLFFKPSCPSRRGEGTKTQPSPFPPVTLFFLRDDKNKTQIAFFSLGFKGYFFFPPSVFRTCQLIFFFCLSARTFWPRQNRRRFPMNTRPLSATPALFCWFFFSPQVFLKTSPPPGKSTFLNKNANLTDYARSSFWTNEI